MRESPEDIGTLMSAVIASITSDAEQGIRPHLQWVVQEIFSKFYLEELTVGELSTLAAVSILIHSRLLVQGSGLKPSPGSGRRLRPV